MATAKHNANAPLCRGRGFIRANGGLPAVVKHGLRKLRERGVVHTARVILVNLMPPPSDPLQSYRRYMAWQEPRQQRLLRQQTAVDAPPPSLAIIRLIPAAGSGALFHGRANARARLPANWRLTTLTATLTADAFNQVLHRETSDYFAILPPQSRLSAAAPAIINSFLARAASDAASANRPRPVLIYTDEDQLDDRGSRCHPHFKPDWSPDTLLSWPYIGNLAIFERRHVLAIDGFCNDFTSAETLLYDMALRATRHLSAHGTDGLPDDAAAATHAVKHIAAVLCHNAPKPDRRGAEIRSAETREAQRRAAAARGMALAFEPSASRGEWRSSKPELGFADMLELAHPRPLPDSAAHLVSIIIPTRDNAADLAKCLGSIRERTTHRQLEIIIVDNGSRDTATLDFLRHVTPAITTARGITVPVTVLTLDIPFNFSILNNRATAIANGDYLLFLNNDTEVISPDWLERLLGHACKPWAGAVGATLLYPDGSIQHAGAATVGAGTAHVFGHCPPEYPHPRCQRDGNWSAVTAACLMVNAAKFRSIGGYDEELAVAFNDVELCYRLAHHGWFSILASQARLYHHEFRTRGDDRASPDRRKRSENELACLFARWPAMRQDPFYHPALSRSYSNFMPRGWI